MTEKTQAPKTAVVVQNLDEVTLVNNKNGQLRRINSKLQLCVEDGTLVKIINGKPASGKYPAKAPVLIPTATGFMQEAAKCGVVLDPNRDKLEVMVGGSIHGNGYQDASGTYFFRARAGGYTALGGKFVTDRTVDYNVDRYNVQDLLAKAKYNENKDFFKVLPFRGKDEFGVLRGEPEQGDWAGYQVDGSTVLWVDCAAPEFVKWLGEMNNRAKNAIRTCQTFADRNALACHPALPVKKKFEKTSVVLDCVSWFAPKGAIDIFKQLTAGEDDTIVYDTAAVSLNEDPDAKEIIDVEASNAPETAEDVLEEEEPPLEDDRDQSQQEPPPKKEAEKPKAEKKKATKKAAVPKKEEPPAASTEHDDLVAKVKTMANGRMISYKKARSTMEIPEETDVDDLTDDQLKSLITMLKMAGNTAQA